MGYGLTDVVGVWWGYLLLWRDLAEDILGHACICTEQQADSKEKVKQYRFTHSSLLLHSITFPSYFALQIKSKR